MTLVNKLNKFARNDSGATAIEYGLIAGLIAVVCITILTSLGGNLEDRFTSIRDAVDGTP